MNKIMLIGNLASDVDVRVTSNGNKQATFRLAVKRKVKNANGVYEADFINIVCWRQLAELCEKYLVKGRKVGVEGALQNRTFEAKDGTKRYITEVIAESVEFINTSGSSEGTAPTYNKVEPNDYEDVDIGDLPF